LSAQQRLALREVPVDPPPVVDRAGVPLFTWQTVVTVALDRSKTPDMAAVAAPLAAALGQFDPMINEQSIIAGANAAPAGQPSAVAVLRERDYESVRDRIYDLPGVSFPTQRQLLAPDRGFATQLVPGIRAVLERQLDNAAGWRIVTVNPMGEEVEILASEQPHPVPTMATTVDRAVQTAAEQAVDTVSNAAWWWPATRPPGRSSAARHDLAGALRCPRSRAATPRSPARPGWRRPRRASGGPHAVPPAARAGGGWSAPRPSWRSSSAWSWPTTWACTSTSTSASSGSRR